MNNRLKANLSLLLTALIWGIAGPVIKYTSRFIKPFSFLFWRFFVTSLISLPIFLFYQQKKKIKLSGKRIKKLIFLGFLGAVAPLIFLFIGVRYTTAIDSSLIGCLAPIMVIIGGAVFLKEKVTNQEKIGAILAFLGSIITIIQPVLEHKAFALKNMSGNILILLSTIIWAVYCLFLRRSENKDKTDPFILTVAGFFIGLIVIIPFLFWETSSTIQKPLTINPLALPGILYMSIFSSIIAYFTYNLGYSLIEASEATLFDYLKPVFAVPLAVFWLGEKITFPFLIGAIFIFLGVFLTEYKKNKTSS